MHYFHYLDGELYCEETSLARLAEQWGTPLYVYSHRTVCRHYQAFDSAFAAYPHLVCFSVKANSTLALLRLLGNQGAGADVVSGGELFRARRAGVPAQKIVYSGVGKTEEEICYALQSGILMFNIESAQELEVIDRQAAALKVRAPIAFRVNPDIDPKTHPYISTGLRKNKFGIDIGRSLEQYRHARSLRHIEVVGIDCHIGSQITELGPFVDALRRVKRLVWALGEEGMEIRYLDLGGGLGITYDQEVPPEPRDYAQAVLEEIGDLPLTLVLEPGRVIVGNAGILLSRVLYTKVSGEKEFVVVDAGMNDLIRPSLYNAYQEIVPVRKSDRGLVKADIVGPICESGDFLARDRLVPQFERGELLAVMSAGAYGFSMSSNYNSRPRPAEVLVAGQDSFLIRARESYEDLLRGESIPAFLQAVGLETCSR